MMKYIYIFIINTLAMQTIIATKPEPFPIIYQISPPRSGSTALLRSFEQNQNFTILNEPTIKTWNTANLPEFVDKWFLKSIPSSYEEVKKLICIKSQNETVYIKDIIFSAYPWLKNDNEFINNPQVKFLCLIRNPYDTLVSFYNKMGLRDEFETILGYKQLWKFFKHAKKHLSEDKYIIISSEELFSRPEKTLKKIYKQFGLLFTPEILNWQSYNQDFDGSTWHEAKHINAFQRWHGDALKSNCFTPLKTTSPDFEDFPEEHRIELKEIYERALKYYNKLIKAIR